MGDIEEGDCTRKPLRKIRICLWQAVQRRLTRRCAAFPLRSITVGELARCTFQIVIGNSDDCIVLRLCNIPVAIGLNEISLPGRQIQVLMPELPELPQHFVEFRLKDGIVPPQETTSHSFHKIIVWDKIPTAEI